MASLDKLHNNLKNEYDLPDLETFKKDMSNPINLRKFYDTLKKDGYDLPDFDTFSKEMFSPTTQAKFIPCVQKKGKLFATKRSGMIIQYKVTVWDKPKVAVYQTLNGTSSRFKVLSGMHDSKMGTVTCTQTGKAFYVFDKEKSNNEKTNDEKTGGDGNVVVKTKKVFYDCSSVNLDTTPLTYGCKDPRIAQIQECLGVTPVDGKFGPITRKSLLDDGFDIQGGITKDIYNKVLKMCEAPKTGETVKPADNVDNSLALTNDYIKRNPIKMNFGKIPDMPLKTSTIASTVAQGMTDAKYYQSLVDIGLIQKNIAGRIAYNGPVLEPEEKTKLDNQASVLGYIPTKKDSATDEGARYVWKRK
jgi:hypothetical protein